VQQVLKFMVPLYKLNGNWLQSVKKARRLDQSIQRGKRGRMRYIQVYDKKHSALHYLESVSRISPVKPLFQPQPFLPLPPTQLGFALNQ
jgi:hypothetical protein